MLYRLPLFAAMAFALGGCVISSPEMLLEATEAVAPLPDRFTMHPYAERDDGYRLSSDSPITYTRTGADYVAGDNSVTLRFAELGGDTYLVAVHGGEANTLYGTVDLHGDVLLINMVLDEIAPEALRDLPPEIGGDVLSEEGGIIVSSRAALDHVIAQLRSGTLVTSPLVAWITTDPAATPPARIVNDADGWHPAD